MPMTFLDWMLTVILLSFFGFCLRAVYLDIRLWNKVKKQLKEIDNQTPDQKKENT